MCFDRFQYNRVRIESLLLPLTIITLFHFDDGLRMHMEVSHFVSIIVSSPIIKVDTPRLDTETVDFGIGIML